MSLDGGRRGHGCVNVSIERLTEGKVVCIAQPLLVPEGSLFHHRNGFELR